MSKIENTWRLAPVAAAQHELAEVRAALGFLPQGYTAMAGLARLADLLAAAGPSSTSPAVSTEQDEPITVTVGHDPRGVSVGVWQGSHCIYSGAHPLPVPPGVSTVEDAPAAGDARGAVTLVTRQGRGQELFTYTSQPCDSVIAWRIGEACSKAGQASAGDYIDRALSLLKELQRKGYGIADISAVQRKGNA